MSLPEMKAEIAQMSPEERRHLAAYIVSLNSNLDPDFRRKLAEKIDDKTPGRWVTIDEAEHMFADD